MSTEIAVIHDPREVFGHLHVTMHAGPAHLGDDRRCIQVTQADGDYITVSIEQWQALVAATMAALKVPVEADKPRPRAIEAISTSSHRDVYVVVDRILEIQIEPGKPYGAGDHGWTARMLLDSPIEISCYRIFDTEEQARAFARETLGFAEPWKEIK